VALVLGGEGNAAWLRRALADWLFVAALGLSEFATLGVAPAESNWSQRRAAIVAAVREHLGADLT
jgi:hypothetical protein